jgi:hypothetical protein
MSRFVLINLVVGFVALAIGFGDISGLPNQVVFVARLLSGLCLLLLAAYWISSISSEPRVHKRRPNNHRPARRSAGPR